MGGDYFLVSEAYLRCCAGLERFGNPHQVTKALAITQRKYRPIYCNVTAHVFANQGLKTMQNKNR